MASTEPVSIKHWWIKTELLGHDSIISVVCNQNDLIVSGDRNGIMKYWSLKTKECLATIKAHDDNITSLCIQGDTIISGSHDKTIKILSLLSAEPKQILFGHNNPVLSLCLEKDCLISGSSNGEIKVWSISTTECLQTIKAHKSGVNSLCFFKDYVISGSSDKLVKAWFKISGDNTLLKYYRILGQHPDAVTAIAVKDDNIISVSNNCLMSWKIDGLYEVFSDIHSNTVFVHNRVIVTGNDQTIEIHRLSNGQHLKSLKCLGAATSLCCYSNNIIASNGEIIYIFTYQ